jgi:hypothetical protein
MIGQESGVTETDVTEKDPTIVGNFLQRNGGECLVSTKHQA